MVAIVLIWCMVLLVAWWAVRATYVIRRFQAGPCAGGCCPVCEYPRGPEGSTSVRCPECGVNTRRFNAPLFWLSSRSIRAELRRGVRDGLLCALLAVAWYCCATHWSNLAPSGLVEWAAQRAPTARQLAERRGVVDPSLVAPRGGQDAARCRTPYDFAIWDQDARAELCHWRTVLDASVMDPSAELGPDRLDLHTDYAMILYQVKTHPGIADDALDMLPELRESLVRWAEAVDRINLQRTADFDERWMRLCMLQSLSKRLVPLVDKSTEQLLRESGDCFGWW